MTRERDLDTLGEYALRGFSIAEPNDHVVVLKYHDEEIAKFNQTTATREVLQSQCASHLVEVGEEPVHTLKEEGVTEESEEDLRTMREDLRRE